MTEHVRLTIADSRVNIRRLTGWNPSRVSNLDSASGLVVQKTVRQVFRDALVSPTLMLGASDSRRFAGISESAVSHQPSAIWPSAPHQSSAVNDRYPPRPSGVRPSGIGHQPLTQGKVLMADG